MKRYSTNLAEPNAKRMKTEDSAESLKKMQAALDEKLKQLDEKIEGASELDFEKEPVKGILKKPGSVQKRKKVRFTTDAKTQDGDSARRYARPDFMKNDGGVLRPKTEAEIEEEIRKGVLVDKVREVIVMEDEEESSEDEPYDPNKPNNYEQYCRDVKRKKTQNQRQARERAERHLRQKEAENAGRMHTQLLNVELVNARIPKETTHIPPAKKEKSKQLWKKDVRKNGLEKRRRVGIKSTRSQRLPRPRSK